MDEIGHLTSATQFSPVEFAGIQTCQPLRVHVSMASAWPVLQRGRVLRDIFCLSAGDRSCLFSSAATASTNVLCLHSVSSNACACANHGVTDGTKGCGRQQSGHASAVTCCNTAHQRSSLNTRVSVHVGCTTMFGSRAYSSNCKDEIPLKYTKTLTAEQAARDRIDNSSVEANRAGADDLLSSDSKSVVGFMPADATQVCYRRNRESSVVQLIFSWIL